MVKKNSWICKLHFHHPLTGQISSSFALWLKSMDPRFPLLPFLFFCFFIVFFLLLFSFACSSPCIYFFPSSCLCLSLISLFKLAASSPISILLFFNINIFVFKISWCNQFYHRHFFSHSHTNFSLILGFTFLSLLLFFLNAFAILFLSSNLLTLAFF